MCFFPISRSRIAQTSVLALCLFVLHLVSSLRTVEGQEATWSVVSSPLTVSPTTLSFGKVPKGGEKDLTVTLANVGSVALQGSFSVPRPYCVIAPETTSFAIQPGQSVNKTISFCPIDQGSFLESISFSSDDGNASLTVQGEGIEAVAVIQAHGMGGSSQHFSADDALRDWSGNECQWPEAVSRPECQPTMGQLLQSAGILVAQPFDYHEKTSGLSKGFRETGWSIEELAGELHRHIEEVLRGDGVDIIVPGFRFRRGTRVDRVDVVAYSMGGLIARAYIANMALDKSNICLTPSNVKSCGVKEWCNGVPYNGKIRTLITVGTPHYGANVAKLALVLKPNKQIREMAYGSEFIRGLHDRWDCLGRFSISVGSILSIAGTAPEGADDDGVVNLASAGQPLDFLPNNDALRYAPYKHNGSTPPNTLVGIDDEHHVTYQLVRDFLRSGSTLSLYSPGNRATEQGLLFVRLIDKQTGDAINDNSGIIVSLGGRVWRRVDKGGTYTFWPVDQGDYTLFVSTPWKSKYAEPDPIPVLVIGGRPHVVRVELSKKN